MSTTANPQADPQAAESHLSDAEIAPRPPQGESQGSDREDRLYVGMAFIVLYCIIPFYWMVVSSLRLPTEGRSTEFIPNPVSFANYVGVFSGTNNFGRSLINSLIVSGHHHPDLLFGIVAAYALARLSFRARAECSG